MYTYHMHCCGVTVQLRFSSCELINKSTNIGTTTGTFNIVALELQHWTLIDCIPSLHSRTGAIVSVEGRSQDGLISRILRYVRVMYREAKLEKPLALEQHIRRLAAKLHCKRSNLLNGTVRQVPEICQVYFLQRC